MTCFLGEDEPPSWLIRVSLKDLRSHVASRIGLKQHYFNLIQIYGQNGKSCLDWIQEYTV